MKKHLFLLLLVSCLLLCLSACGEGVNTSETAPPPSEGLAFTLSEDGNYYIVSGIGDCKDTDIIIPSTHQDIPVESIGEKAFWECSSLKSIIIPDSITSIGDLAFYKCTSLVSITVPDGVTHICADTFGACSSLQYNMYDNAYYLGNTQNPYVALVKVKKSSISSCRIHEETKTIASKAFWGSSVKSVTISDSVTSIGDDVFSGCTSLESIAIPDGVTRIGNGMFDSCFSLESVTLPDGLISIGDEAFWDCSALRNINIPKSVKSIGDKAFEYCSSLESIAIPDGVTSIGCQTFSDCHALRSIIIPNSVTYIGDLAFDFYSCILTVYYTGTEEQWEQIDIKRENIALKNATIHYNYTPEE